jgi:hypothetical protein
MCSGITYIIPQVWVSVDLNLIAACEVLGVAEELLMNPINIHVDNSTQLINGCSD